MKTELIETFSPGLQLIADYVEQGGNDVIDFAQKVAQLEATDYLDVAEDSDQETIVRAYYAMTSKLKPDEIEEEITKYKDRGELAARAEKLKPRVIEEQQKSLAKEMQKQKYMKEQLNKRRANYITGVAEVLKTGEINGIKVDKNTQGKLFAGLTQPTYALPSGAMVNEFTYLLNKHQTDSNHSVLAEVLWLLSDPEGYKKQLKEAGAKNSIENTVKKLKTEEGRKIASAQADDEEEEKKKKVSAVQGIPRQTNIFRRM
jgi:hypothetical protein